MRPVLKRVMAAVALVSAASGLTLLAVRAQAAGVPDAKALTYTGYLESAEGAPLTGTHPVSVNFWESNEAADPLCTGKAPDTELQSGRFQVELPDSCADAIKASSDVWVEVEIDGAPLGRTKLGAVPYALEAGHAVSATSAEGAESATSATGDLADELALALASAATQGKSIDPVDGTSVGTSDAQGHLTINFPQAFPGGLQSVIAINASADLGGGVAGTTGQSKTGFQVGMAGNTFIRINWFALGW